jgi:Peptidase C13 family
MEVSESAESFERVRESAFRTLTAEQRLTTNLHLDTRIYEEGEQLGPEFQNIRADRASILVFADDAPLANFGHDCRYLLHDPDDGSLFAEIPARFPPFGNKPPDTLTTFHEPVRVSPNPDIFRMWPRLRCPILFPRGNRYAILYSGMSNMRHLNDLEFCYRMLVDRYGFRPANIYSLNYDGTLDTQDGVAGLWPGDNTAYRINITGQGNRAAFQNALNAISPNLDSADTLFIHTNNHGDNFGQGSFLCAYPNWGTYTATDFCSDLGALPGYRSLIVMMEQCNAGGFNSPIIAASTAASTSVASAAIATQSSWASADGHWDSFARDWIAAQIGHDPYGAALAFNPDTNMNGVIEAEEAFGYADAIHYSGDSPNFSESSEAGGDIALSQHYVWWWWWCWILLPVLEEYYRPWPPDPEFYEKLHKVIPELQEQLSPELDRAAREIHSELTAKVQAAIQEGFGAKGR